MIRVIATAVTPVFLTLLSPIGITETTPVGEAIVLIIVALGTGGVAWWAQRGNRHD